jgi:LysM repeat protein
VSGRNLLSSTANDAKRPTLCTQYGMANAAAPSLHLITAFLASIAITVAFLLVGPAALAQSVPRISHRLVGLHEAYVVQKGDTLRSLSSRHGIPVAVLARDNRLAPDAHLKVGQTLRIDDRHIVPAEIDDRILINVPQLWCSSSGMAPSRPLTRPRWASRPGKLRTAPLRWLSCADIRFGAYRGRSSARWFTSTNPPRSPFLGLPKNSANTPRPQACRVTHANTGSPAVSAGDIHEKSL